jgi:two-component system chemotaxis sensor kinase CheA
VTDPLDNPGDQPAEEMSEYLQVFMDETEEQLEALVEVMLVLERAPESVDKLNEAFRLVHTIKGSSGMMGLDSIAALAHHLESRFEALRSGLARLDEPTMNLVLRCIDFLRECMQRLGAGRVLGSAAELLEELTGYPHKPEAASPPAAERPAAPEPAAPEPSAPTPAAAPEGAVAGVTEDPIEDTERYQLTIRFEEGLLLADLKARLIIARLTELGEIVSTHPSAVELETIESLSEFEVVVTSEHDEGEIREAVSLDGVHAVEIHGAADKLSVPAVEAHEPAPEPQPEPEPEPELRPEPEPEPEPVLSEPEASPEPEPEPHSVEPSAPAPAPVADAAPETPQPAAATSGKARLAETMRVDIDRLDSLMNLAGELVVNRARFVQVAGQMAPAFGQRSMTSRARDFAENLRRTVAHLEGMVGSNGELARDIEELKAGLRLVEEQSGMWDSGRRGFAQINEAIDQLSRISTSLQQGVLDTRMVAVAPLFNRFKRVVRDLSAERGKKVTLQIHGENTELDKRMIDELGDPLVHLVRNSIDHGLEPPDVRLARGKPEAGTIFLEASHSGNNVFIRVRDDGGGIDVARIKQRLVARQILTEAEAEGLTNEQAIEFIWHPGFSTAQEVTDVSGRGVGMDAVRARITDLSGWIDVDSTPEQGTVFTIRLPLTLAIINSLLIRIRDVIFSMPIEDVREIVAVPPKDIVTVHGRQTIDVRGEFLPLISIDDVFDWNQLGSGAGAPEAANGSDVHAVILQTGDRVMGLRVDELLGSQDIVIKSLSENFVPIRGLSGASILGDGTVCLMLDVGTLIDMVFAPSWRSELNKEPELDSAR